MRSFGCFVNAGVVVAAVVVGGVDVDAVAFVEVDLCICNRIEQIAVQCFPNAGTVISLALGIGDIVVRFPAFESTSIRWISSASLSSASVSCDDGDGSNSVSERKKTH